MKKEIPALRGNNLTMRESNANKKLLTLKEVCENLGIGQTKDREQVRGHNGFGVQIGNRWYADKSKLDRWIDTMAL